MRPQRKHYLFASCFLPLVALGLLVIILLSAYVLTVPSQASEIFGQPATSITGFQRYWLSLQLLLQQEALLQPANPGAQPQLFIIEPGEATSTVIQKLSTAGLLRSGNAFRNYLVYTGIDTALQSGEHDLSAAMNAIELAQALQTFAPGETSFSMLAGWRIEEAAAALPYTGLEIDPESFLQAAGAHPTSGFLTSEIPSWAGCEGFLFPGAYVTPREITAPELIGRMLANFEAAITPEMQAGFASQGLSLYQAVTLASIIEREAVHAEEMPLIASVFYNRLAIGMKLDTDPTVQYSLGYQEGRGGWWPNPLYREDFQMDSPYNTYLYTGLPPGPISNPGQSALRAVAYPTQSPYFYFRARCDGSHLHNFAETYSEHLNNACP